MTHRTGIIRRAHPSHASRRCGGFTLVEALVSAMLLAVTVIVIAGLCTGYQRDTAVSAAWLHAGDLAEAALVQAFSLDRSIANDPTLDASVGRTVRTFSDSEGAFTTILTVKRYAPGPPNLLTLTATVTWGPPERPYTLSRSTLLWTGSLPAAVAPGRSEGP